MKMNKTAMRVLAILIVGIFLLPVTASAASGGLIDDTVNPDNAYSEYPSDNYQLDFYVSTDWDWLPWNWGSGISNKIEHAVYSITDALWGLSRLLSNATGYIVQEAYKLDFIATASDAIGANMQTMAGVTSSGFSSTGFFPGLLLMLTLILGMYVAYVGLIKRETTKAISAAVNFVLIFIVSAGFLAYAPDYVAKINEFSSDMSMAALDVGTRIVMPDSESRGSDSTDLIRDNLYAIQVRQPWLLLQYGTTDVSSLSDGEARVEALLSTSPDDNNGQDREEIVKDEIENYGNMNLSVNKVANRLGTVLLLLIVNIAISVFVILFAGLMIFSQILFIMYATVLPLSLILSIIPTFNGLAKRSIEKVFNAILLRTGYTVIITVAFSISSMLYTISGSWPLLFVCFLQIATFAGIYIKQGDLLSMILLQGQDNQSLVRRTRFAARRTQMQARRFGRNVSRMVGKAQKTFTRTSGGRSGGGGGGSAGGGSGGGASGGGGSGGGSSQSATRTAGASASRPNDGGNNESGGDNKTMPSPGSGQRKQDTKTTRQNAPGSPKRDNVPDDRDGNDYAQRMADREQYWEGKLDPDKKNTTKDKTARPVVASGSGAARDLADQQESGQARPAFRQTSGNAYERDNVTSSSRAAHGQADRQENGQARPASRQTSGGVAERENVASGSRAAHGQADRQENGQPRPASRQTSGGVAERENVASGSRAAHGQADRQESGQARPASRQTSGGINERENVASGSRAARDQADRQEDGQARPVSWQTIDGANERDNVASGSGAGQAGRQDDEQARPISRQINGDVNERDNMASGSRAAHDLADQHESEQARPVSRQVSSDANERNNVSSGYRENGQAIRQDNEQARSVSRQTSSGASNGASGSRSAHVDQTDRRGGGRASSPGGGSVSNSRDTVSGKNQSYRINGKEVDRRQAENFTGVEDDRRKPKRSKGRGRDT